MRCTLRGASSRSWRERVHALSVVLCVGGRVAGRLPTWRDTLGTLSARCWVRWPRPVGAELCVPPRLMLSVWMLAAA